MDRLRITALENSDHRSVFTFEKVPSFFSLFSHILEGLGLEALPEYHDSPFTIEDATDTVEHRANELYDVDIFYGVRHIVVIVRSSVPREQYLHHFTRFATAKGFD